MSGDEVIRAVALKCSDPIVLEVVDVEAVAEVDDVGKRNDIMGCV